MRKQHVLVMKGIFPSLRSFSVDCFVVFKSKSLMLCLLKIWSRFLLNCSIQSRLVIRFDNGILLIGTSVLTADRPRSSADRFKGTNCAQHCHGETFLMQSGWDSASHELTVACVTSFSVSIFQRGCGKREDWFEEWYKLIFFPLHQ